MSHDGHLGARAAAARTDGTGSLDRLFDALASATRRTAVAYLAEVDRAVTVDELVAHVADERPSSEPGRHEHERVAALFHHNHLPRLVDADLVIYDVGSGVVSPTDRALDAARCLDALGTDDDHST